jgi:heterodisulfide reductase subunit B
MKRYYSFFPGCSSSHGGSKAYGQSIQAITKPLDIDLIELEEWNCCGSTPYTSVNELASYCCSARNLALAEKRGLDLITPCSSCYVILNRTNLDLKEYPTLKNKVGEALAAGNLTYNGSVRVRHLLEVITTDIGFDAISTRVTNNLKGLNVAPYYGCQIVRPRLGFDNPEYPQTMDKLINSLGAVATPFPLKSRCCGGSLIIPEEKITLDLIFNILQDAVNNGAECIVTVCPLCQTNLDVYQNRVNKKYRSKFKLPILFFTQLIGLAFGIDARTLGINQCIMSAEKVITACTAE